MFCRTQSFGHTDHCRNWWCVQLQMMFAFFSTYITRWWQDLTKDHFGVLQSVVLFIVDVFASTILILLTGHLSLLFQVFRIWKTICYNFPHHVLKIQWLKLNFIIPTIPLLHPRWLLFSLLRLHSGIYFGLLIVRCYKSYSVVPFWQLLFITVLSFLNFHSIISSN